MSLEFRIAKTEKEIEDIFKLRYATYVQKEYFNSGDFPGEMESDEYDSISVHFYVFNKKLGRVVGTIRLVPDNQLGLPLEEIFDISSIRANGRRLAEVSRRITERNHVKANFGLLQTVCQYSRRHNISDFVFVVNPEDVSQYKSFGARIFDRIKYYKRVNNWAVPFHVAISKFNPPFDTLLYSHNPSIFID